MSPVTMADLADGTRVRHPKWLEAGTIRVVGGSTEISPEGVVFPSDLEIIGEAAP